LVPTLLEAAGVDVAKAIGPLDGLSIMPELRGKPQPPRKLYWHFPNYTNQGGRPAGAIRNGNWKLIENFEDGSFELYDLAEDASEQNNLASSKPTRVDYLSRELKAWQMRVGARMPTRNPEFDATSHRRLYVQQDPSKLVPESTAASTEPQWLDWREAMNAATKGRKAPITPATGDIRLHAKDARVHGKTLRYEPQPNKNTLGFWKNADDWADWDFAIATPGMYEVEIQQGCGDGSGGAEVAVEVGGKTLKFTVQETGHFQQMILRVIGQVELSAGKHTLSIKPQSKPGPAVMDLRRVVLRPAP
ncbi:MAG TPA: sulfatase/phosphatase domain-containing protein, partial [Pirellulales bacterium]|nr:sulfatase/phosphatase domain-containing protein [Pirellulales bacterium]